MQKTLYSDGLGGGKKHPSPFDLAAGAAYDRWREDKLASLPSNAAAVLVEVGSPAALTPAERGEIANRLKKYNMSVYAGPPTPDLGKEGVRALGQTFGLTHLDSNMLADDDGITPLAVAAGGTRTRYIPYTDKPLAWHTDGYYNDADHQVRSLVLHCVRPAQQGGENDLLDPEIAYIRLRDIDPAHIAALSAEDAMTIPGVAEEGATPRPARAGPVFRIMADGRLHMRYTRRKTNIVWADRPEVHAAVAALETLLDSDDPAKVCHRLEAGQGLICANVLHNRRRFVDAEDSTQGRLLYRARYFDALSL